MAIQQEVFEELQKIKQKIIEKGGSVSQANKNVSLPELTAGVGSIPEGGNCYKIITAELADVTIELYKGEEMKTSAQTGPDGGKVEFELAEPGEYKIVAKKAESELWNNTITLNEIGVYNCKSGKPLEEYDWQDVKKARKGDFARYMWSVGDVIYLPSFMGSSDQQYTKCTISTFDRPRNVDGSGDKFMGLMIAPTSATYRHRETSGSNGISWVGSLVRKNGLKVGESQYVYDDTVSAETSGTYYVLNEDCKNFDEVTLPDNFDESKKYYTKTIMEEDGAFIAGLPEEVKELLEQVEVATWGGGIGRSDRNENDNTIIKTEDWIYSPSDSEIFGDKIDDRFSTHYSKIGLEGKQLEQCVVALSGYCQRHQFLHLGQLRLCQHQRRQRCVQGCPLLLHLIFYNQHAAKRAYKG